MEPSDEGNNSFIVRGLLVSCLHEDKSEMKVVDEEINETVNLSSLMMLTDTPPEDLFLSWIAPKSSYVLHELKQSFS